MRLEEYLVKAKDIDKLRAHIYGVLAKDSEALKDVVLTEFVRLSKQYPNLKVSDVEDFVLSNLKISPAQTKALRTHLAQGQELLANAHADLLIDAGLSFPSVEWETVQSLHRVNFAKINQDVNKTVISHMERIFREGKGILSLEKSLRESKIVDYQARTLSRTAVAGFDNDYSVTLASEAGIELFRWSGPPAQRPICKKNLGKNFTKKQLRGASNGQGLPVITHLGGYNCQHNLLANPFATHSDSIYSL